VVTKRVIAYCMDRREIAEAKRVLTSAVEGVLRALGGLPARHAGRIGPTRPRTSSAASGRFAAMLDRTPSWSSQPATFLVLLNPETEDLPITPTTWLTSFMPSVSPAKELVAVGRPYPALALSENAKAHLKLGAFAITLHRWRFSGGPDSLFEALTLAAERRRQLHEADGGRRGDERCPQVAGHPPRRRQRVRLAPSGGVVTPADRDLQGRRLRGRPHRTRPCQRARRST
jgi:hypothetical protein